MRRSIVLALACVCLSFACKSEEPDTSADEPPAIEPTPTTPPVGAWVVIDEQRGMFKTANLDAGQIPSAPGSRIRVAEVVGIAGEFIEVRTVALRPDQICTDLAAESNYELRFFIRTEALHQVLARPKQVEFDDGTKFTLASGVPVIETDAGAKLVRVGNESLAVPLDDDDVGRWFKASLVAYPGDPGPMLRTLGLVLHYGEQSFTADADPFLEAIDHRALEHGQLLTFINTCGRFDLRSEVDPPKTGLYAMKGPKDAIPSMARNFDPDMVARDAGILGLVQQGGHFLPTPDGEAIGDDDLWGCSTLTWTASVDTPLTWLGGGEAGKVLTAHELPRSAKERDDRVCFAASGLDVCLATAKLERQGSDADCKPIEELIDRTNKRIPEVRQLKVTVGKGLNRDIVRRIIRAHINELRSCYNAEFREHPTLAGRVEIAFTIDATGKASTSSAQASSLEPANDRVTACFTKSFERWIFPKPQSGESVDVVAPFMLSSTPSSE